MAENPISLVHQFYQKHHIDPSHLRYEYSSFCSDTPNPMQIFSCSLQLPRVTVSDAGTVQTVLDEQLFLGEGRSKKDAKRSAAENALVFLQEQPIYQALTQELTPLESTLDTCFTNQGIQKDPDLRAFWTGRQLMVNCLRGLGIRSQELLLQLQPSGTMTSTSGHPSSSATSRSPVALGSEIWEEDPVGVLVPVDIRDAVQEVTLMASAPLLPQVCGFLGIGDNPLSLVIWDRQWTGMKAPRKEKAPLPTLYSVFHDSEQQAEAAGLNLRASWLAGVRVHGPAVLSACGVVRGL
eukprot:gene3843-4100_t